MGSASPSGTVASFAVRSLHVALIAFVLAAPFSSNPALLRLHSMAVPSIVFHWMVNSDVCCLTLLENRLRGAPLSETNGFVHSVVAPVYNVHREDAAYVSWAVALLTWLVSISRIPGSSGPPPPRSGRAAVTGRLSVQKAPGPRGEDHILSRRWSAPPPRPS